MPANNIDSLSFKPQNPELSLIPFLLVLKCLSCELLQVLYFWYSFGFSLFLSFSSFQIGLFYMTVSQSFLCMVSGLTFLNKDWFYYPLPKNIQ